MTKINVEQTLAFKEQVISALNESPFVSIEFNKLDGTKRTINATLNELRMSAKQLPKVGKAKKTLEESTTLNMYDIDLDEWRSCRWDSIISVTH